MHRSAKILVVDDEQAIRFALEEVLDRDGHQVVAVDSGEAALARMEREPFDLALLDLKMKGLSGLDVLAWMRQRSLDTAVIVLTAHGSLETAIDALRRGAHDYLLKPCDTADLRESVRTALLKRQREQRQQDLLRQVEQSLNASLEEIRAAVVGQQPVAELGAADAGSEPARPSSVGRLAIDSARHTVTLDGRPLDLSPTEFDLVAYLARAAPRVVAPQELVREVLGYEAQRFEASEIVRHYVYRIRAKAKPCAAQSEIIRTVRSVGYALNL